ncbi:MAG: XRE family transcriptional regulator [Mesorhizobium sp.]|uniref:helix-turn-helix domain-containing protein n=1 Tax=Mesorhizobium sp. TaxID=1871066 RepID=UPI000FE87989|nr:helix-turn-helix transcriptional regulator [Mesorhizobium sp.]RWB85953.1 MAG: XRE family transcriptional regulator [Mesorhizobium sp.]
MSAIRHIRCHIFKLNQAEFAAIAGVTQASVSRWEAGTAPSLDEMRAIREAAIERNIEWNDSWFFEVPAKSSVESPGGAEGPATSSSSPCLSPEVAAP